MRARTLGFTAILCALAALACRSSSKSATPGGGFAGMDPCATALFCDDFESASDVVGQAPGGSWRAQTNLGTVAIDSAQSRSGTKSVKVTTQARTTNGGKTAFIRLVDARVLPVPGNVFYGRMMFRLESAPTASVHWTFVDGGGLIAGQTYHALYRYGGQLPITQGTTFIGSQLMANYETPDWYARMGPGSDCWQHATKVVVPAGTWTCVEWQFDGPNNQMRLWLNGAAVEGLTVSGVGSGCVNQPASYPWTAPTFDHIDLGWESYQADDARTAWIDDVVVSKTRIGCP